MPRIIWGTLAAAAVTITLTGCGLTSNAGPAAAEGGGSATPTTSTTAETPGSGLGTGTDSPGNGSPTSGAPSTGTGGGSGTGSGDGSGTGAGNGSGSGTGTGTGEGDAPGDGRGGDGDGGGAGGGGAGGGAGGGGGDYPLCTKGTLSAYLTNRTFVETNRYVTLVLTNTSRTTCVLRDWAHLELLNASGVIETDVRRHGTPRPVTLQGHDSAYARLHWTSEPATDEGNPCQTTATTLRVYTLYQTDPHRLPWTYGPICQHNRIWLTPFAPNTAGY